MSDQTCGPKPARLVVLNGDSEGKVFALVADETIIGRHANTDITLLDDGISREHAIISFEEGSNEFIVEDLQSTNGTKVNDKRVRSATLQPNDQIRIGNTLFRFEIGIPSAS